MEADEQLRTLHHRRPRPDRLREQQRADDPPHLHLSVRPTRIGPSALLGGPTGGLTMNGCEGGHGDVDEELLDAIETQLRQLWAKNPPRLNPDAKPDDIEALRKRLTEENDDLPMSEGY
jgi:hypothetical protein